MPGFRGWIGSMTSALLPIKAPTLDAWGFGVKRNLARGIMSGVSAMETMAKTIQGSHGAVKKTPAIAAPKAPNAMQTKKKWVGGGRISKITNPTQAMSQYL